jgi:hypothetical protein
MSKSKRGVAAAMSGLSMWFVENSSNKIARLLPILVYVPVFTQ